MSGIIKVFQEISWQIVGNTVYIFNERTKEVHCLNKTGLEYWNILMNNEPSDDLHKMAQKYNVPFQTIEYDLEVFTNQLINKGIIYEK